MLQYVEIRGEMARALNVFKMRGSWHDKGIREYTISADGPKITDSFRNYERIISGSPTRVTVNEKAELSLLLRAFRIMRVLILTKVSMKSVSEQIERTSGTTIIWR